MRQETIRKEENNESSIAKQMYKNNRLRSNTLQKINAWCYRRASHLSLTGHEQAAQALTEEHMESLQNASPKNTLWLEN